MTIVYSFDFSEAAFEGLAGAAAIAARLGRPLVLAYAVGPGIRTLGPGVRERVEDATRTRLEGLAAELKTAEAGLKVGSVQVKGDAVTELLQIKGITPAIYNGTNDRPGLAELVTVRGAGQVNINTAGPHVLEALGLSTPEITQIVQGRRNNGPFQQVPSQFGGRNLSAATRTFRIEADGIMDDRVVARLIAIVQRRTDADPPSVIALEWRRLR